MAKASILLVEDNKYINIANRDMLELLGYRVDISETIAGARMCLAAKTPDVIVLDIMLPDGNGLDFLKELRQGKAAHVPVIMLTALETADDMVNGLSTGADDYLAKPYEYKVLSARIEALLRRAERVPERITKGRLTLDVASGVALLDETDLLLTKKEFALLLFFAQNPERYIDGEYLYEKIWNAPFSDDNQALKSAIKRLRSKLGNSGWCIDWSRGEGYIFEKE